MTIVGRNLNDVVVFVAVVDHGSFSQAARSLGLPPSSVSRKVSRLEKALGVRLLQRTTRKLSLTEAGQLYYDRSEALLRGLDDAESLLANAQQTPRGRVRVLAPLEYGITTAVANAFLHAFPEVRLEIRFDSEAINLIEEGYDVAIHAGPPPLSVVAHKLMDSPFSLVASPAYLADQSAPQRVGELGTHDCVLLGDHTLGHRWTLFEEGQEVTVPVRGRVAVNSLMAARDASIAGHGIALLPRLVCAEGFRAGALVEVLSHASPPPVPLYALVGSGRLLPAAVRAFLTFLKQHFVASAMPSDE